MNCTKGVGGDARNHHYKSTSYGEINNTTHETGNIAKTSNVRVKQDEVVDCYSKLDSSSTIRTNNRSYTKKRLYRDVLDTSNTSNSFEHVTKVIETTETTDEQIEAGFDELERQALEQYRTSEESLALRYQVKYYYYQTIIINDQIQNFLSKLFHFII